MTLPNQKIPDLIAEQADELDIPKDFSDRAVRYLIPLAQSWKPSEILVKVVAEGKRTGDACLALVQTDRPFVVSSLRLLFDSMGLSMRKILHPVLPLDEKEEKKLSLIFVELERPLSAAEGQELTRMVKSRMRVIRHVVNDFPILLAEVGRLSATLQAFGSATNATAKNTSSCGLLEAKDAHQTLMWLMEENFIFLGHARRPVAGTRGQSLDRGIVKSMPAEFTSYLKHIDGYVTQQKDALILEIETLPMASPVHREALMNVVLVVERDANNVPVAWHAFFGIWTSSAIRYPVQEVPFIRRKVEALTQAMLDGHRSSARINFFRHQVANYSWEGFARLSLSELKQSFRRILQLVAFPHPRVTVHQHRFLDSAQVFIHLPRERYNPENRRSIIDYITKKLHARLDTWHVHLGEGMFAHLSLNISYEDGVPTINPEELEGGVAECLRRWSDRYLRILRDTDKSTFDCTFPMSYQTQHSPEEAVRDTKLIASSRRDGVAFSIRPRSEEGPSIEADCVTLALGGSVPSLTQTYPMLERIGLPIAREEVHVITRSNTQSTDTEGSKVALVYFYLDRTALSQENCQKLVTNADTIADLLQKVWLRQSPDDDFNSLCWKAELTFAEIFLWRTIASWMQQMGSPFSLPEQASLLLRYPKITRVITKIFNDFHNPVIKKRPDELTVDDMDALMRPVNIASEDVLFRNYITLVYAIERTNFFIRQTSDPVCIKIASQRCGFLKHPRPFREIYMEHRDFRAVHMRMGLLARGGIRWSNRLQDFRDEVLGLVKAQHVKNVVIVPVGAKGGFVMKQNFSDPKERLDNAIRCYKTFIETLLSITDNQTGKRPQHPKGIICRDGLDPYLVVAADKGTATFSDHANAVARECRFWLDDAFASGGSHGYDHKTMGITARGAWESVKQHSSLLGIDPEKDPISVVGIGDMSGDVFGNGMLLSKTLHLIGAFNHRHIFFNPNPDPEVCYAERKRLFALPGSSWSDYNPALLSEGGAVYDRSLKRITISEICRQRVGADSCRIAPHVLIKCLMTLDVDLLWFGGIGTYVKAASESDHDVNDPSNNACRVNAEDMMCRIVGEGANLGITQKARIVFCRMGGQANTDFIDNSAGVNCSDHEVNIKLLLSIAIKNKTLTMPDRNKLLRRIEPMVAQKVLRTSRSIALALSLQQAQAVQQLPRHRALIQYLESEGKLDRELEHLPDSGEIDRRLANNEGLTRPELAVLSGYAKIDVETSLREQCWSWQGLPANDLMGYFPSGLREQFEKEIKMHPLAGDILATVLINEAMNIAGSSFLHDLHRWLGYSFSRLMHGYVAARDVMGFAVMSGQEDSDWYTRLSKNLLIMLGDSMLPMTAFFAGRIPNHQPKDLIDSYVKHLPAIVSIFTDHVSSSGVTNVMDATNRPTCWFDEINVRHRLQACYVLACARKRKLSHIEVARKVISVGKIYGFDVITHRMSGVALDPAVEAYTRFAMIDRLYRQQTSLAATIVEMGTDDLPQTVDRKRFLSVSNEIVMMQNTSTEQMILWQQAVEKHLNIRTL